MKKLFFPLVIAASSLSMTACCDQVKHQNTNQDKAQATSNHADGANMAGAGAAAASAIAIGNFDWSGINKSSADLGGFPYFNVPEGMKLSVADGSTTDGQPTSKTWEDGKLNIYDGKQIFSTAGKLNYLNLVMAEDGSEFDKTKFDQSVTEQMNKIGAVEFFSDSVPSEAGEQLKGMEGMSHQDYMAGDFADRTLRQFAVNHDNGQLFYQVMSDDKHGEIGVLETQGFSVADADANTNAGINDDAEQVPETTDDATADNTTETAPAEVIVEPVAIENPTADNMMSQLDTSGKAILNIHFDTGKSSIRSDDQSIIEQIHTLMTEHPEVNLSIEGHTDDRGADAMNQSLSQSRAEQVKSVLVAKGIDASRLKAVGHGESKPLVANDTADNQAKNRRVELVKF